MRFDRHFRYEPRERTPARIAAAKRAIRKEKERAGLFGEELMRFTSVEERFAQMDERARHMVSRWRSYDAKIWIKARRLMQTLDTRRRDEVLRVWHSDQWHRARGSMEFLYLVKRVMEPDYFTQYQPSAEELNARRERGKAFTAYLIKRAAALKLYLDKVARRIGGDIERAYVDGEGELNLIPANAKHVRLLNSMGGELLTLFAATMRSEGVEDYTARSLRAGSVK